MTLQRSNHPRRRARRAFTLIEAIATITVLAALGSMASMIIMASVNSYTQAATAAQLHTELSNAMDVIDRELRSIELNDTADAVAPTISAVTPTSIAWNGNSSLSLSSGRVNIARNGGASRELQADVTAFSVRAYNQSNAAMATTLSGGACEPIRRLAVSITVARNGVTQTLRTKVFLRCTLAGAEES